MAFDAAAIADLFFARLATDAAGAALRQELPAGAAGLVVAKNLKKAKPAPPFGVLRQGPVSGDADDVRRLLLTWWWYDDIEYECQRINLLLPLVEAAYPRHWTTVGDTQIGGWGAEIPQDAAMRRPARSFQLIYLRRA
jgi:hypothetical protein